MMFRQSRENETQTSGESQVPTNDGANLNKLREQASALLSVGNEAIEKALSRNHYKFLEATRQQGGQ